MYKRYEGNSGRVRHVEEKAAPPEPAGQFERRPPPPRPGPPPGPPGLRQLLGQLLPGRRPEPPETEDLLLLLILYLMYRESGDTDFLVMLGAMLLG